MSALFSSVSNIGYTGIELKSGKVSTSMPRHEMQLLIHAMTSTVGDLTAVTFRKLKSHYLSHVEKNKAIT